jgi:hypothetical protein
MRPLSVGALRTPFIQRQLNMARFRFPVKEFQKIIFSYAGGQNRDPPLSENGIEIALELDKITHLYYVYGALIAVAIGRKDPWSGCGARPLPN